LIDELLTFSRLSKQNLMKVKLDLGPTVQGVLTDLNNLYPNPDREVNTKLFHNVMGDHAMMRVVMTNLISNAFKYSNNNKKPVIEIGSFSEKEKTIFYVKDNGAGFDMKYYDKLFGVFQRLHSSAEFEGTGVGLAIVNRIITKHDGTIWAESALNHGATFYFSLPNS
jgi:light-regulated signal transduction histidine kinase (bacteriophytochrome)